MSEQTPFGDSVPDRGNTNPWRVDESKKRRDYPATRDPAIPASRTESKRTRPNSDEQVTDFYSFFEATYDAGVDSAYNDPVSSTYAEQIRKLRTELLVRAGQGGKSTLAIAVVSPNPREGRTLLASELAFSFARLGRPTLLIDTDLRSSVEQRRLGAGMVEGLSDVLVSGQPPALNRVEGIPNFCVLGAGSAKGYNPTELLSSSRFRRLAESLSHMFDFVVVDTPAYSLYPDAQLAAAVTGAALPVFKANASTYAEGRAMLRSLAVARTKVWGSVMNSF